MSRAGSYLIAFGSGFAAAAILLAAAGWIAPDATPPVSRQPPAAAIDDRESHAVTNSYDRELLTHCQRRSDSLLAAVPLTFARRSAEMQPETRPLIYGLAEISADCPMANLRIEFGDDSELAARRRDSLAARLSALGVPVDVAAAEAGEPRLRFVEPGATD